MILGGLGGVGKTQLAIAYAKQEQDNYHSIIWLDATSEATLKISFESILAQLLDIRDIEDLSIQQVIHGVKQWLSDKANTSWLLIFDNYDEPTSYDLKSYYPQASHGAIIITTRLPGKVEGSRLKVKTLDNIEHNLQILQTRSERGNVSSDYYARCLANRLGGLPLALATAGSFLQYSTWTFEQYLQNYEALWILDSRQSFQLPDYQNRTLYTTWNLSYRGLKEQDLEAAQMLKLLAYFGHHQISFELFNNGRRATLPDWFQKIISHPLRFESVMGRLVAHNLVQVNLDLKSYSLHTCTHDWLLSELHEKVESWSYWYAFNCVATSIDLKDWESLSQMRYARLAPHAVMLTHKYVIHVLDCISADEFWKADSIAELLRQQVEFEAAKLMLLRALAGKEKVLGVDHASTLTTVNNLGILYVDQGKLAEAETMYLRALAGMEKASEYDHISTLDIINNLGHLYWKQGKLAEAEKMYIRALAGREKALEPTHRWTLQTVSNLGSLYRDQGRLREAETMYLRALHEYEKTPGLNHTLTLSVISNLGTLYRDQGRLREAETMYLRALAEKEKLLGADHTSTLTTVNNLGLVYLDQGRLTEAETMHLRALAGREKALGPDHTSTLDTVNNLGLLRWKQGQLAEAETMYVRALAGREKALGAKSKSVMKTAYDLGILYQAQGRLQEAQIMYERAKSSA